MIAAANAAMSIRAVLRLGGYLAAFYVLEILGLNFE